MFQKLLFIKILLVHYSVQNLSEIQAECGHNVTLSCSGVDRIKFLSVAWYKVHMGETLGIVRKDKGEAKTLDYNFARPAVLGDKYGLVLSNVSPEDSGLYECEIYAGLGDKNQYPRVKLVVDVCPTHAELATTTETNGMNSTQSGSFLQEVDLPVAWSVTGVVSVGLVKIFLSLISILVIRTVQTRSSRR